ncbi:MAG: ABC transporter substrate-binding protein, partial [Candidatus Thorarchaeota archaeon]
IHDVILNHYLSKFNLSKNIQIKNYSQAEFIATDIANNIIEGGVGTPSLAVFASTILDSHIIIPAEYLWPNNPSYGIFAHEDYINNFPELIEKFLLYHKKASYMLREKPKKAVKVISENLKILNQKYVKSVLRISPKYCIALSKEFIETTMEFVDRLHRLRYINTKLDSKDIFILDFVQKLHPEPDHYKL